MTEKSAWSKKVDIAKKRVGDVKGMDKKPLPKAEIKPILKKDKIGFKVTQKFSKGGMAKKKGC